MPIKVRVSSSKAHKVLVRVHRPQWQKLLSY
jgi:uncharacterized protein (DUF302 family)